MQKKAAFLGFLLISVGLLCQAAWAIIGPSVSTTGASIFSVHGEFTAPTFRIKDPDSADIIVDPDTGDYILQKSIIGLDDPLSWQPLTLTNPTIVTLEEDPDDPTKNIQTVSRSPYTSPTTSSTAKTSSMTVNLTSTEDAEIYLPCDDVFEAAQLLVDEGHDVNMIGGSMLANTTATSSIRGLLRFQGNAHKVYAEGLLLDVNNVEGIDALSFGASASYTNQRSDYTFQNLYIKDTALKTEPYHPDGMQMYGDTKTIRIDKVTIKAGATGGFLDQQHIHYALDLRRIDMDYTCPSCWNDPLGNTSQILYLASGAPDDLENRRRAPFGFQHVYAGRRDTFYGISSDGYWTTFSLECQGDCQPNTPEPDSTEAVLGSLFPEWSGHITRYFDGVSPTFVDEADVGLNYTMPAHVGD